MDASKPLKGVIKIPLNRSRDGSSEFDITADAGTIPEISHEIQGDVRVWGTLQTSGNSIRIVASLAGKATLICDRSLEQFVEPLTTEIQLEYSVNNQIAEEQRLLGVILETEVIRGLREDVTYVDLTEDVRQELMLCIPMRKIAPKYRDVDLSKVNEVYRGRKPEDGPDEATQDVWSELKKLKNL